ncbi:MAG: lipoyl(octanoyl) transferase LipB [Cyanobacteria bacterium P01_H01_bin.74]
MQLGYASLMNPIDFGCEPLTDILALQDDLVRKRIAHQIEDTLLIGQHPHVFTAGRQAAKELHFNNSKPFEPIWVESLKAHVPLVPVQRGGKLSYHGPGQLIAYPIILLRPGQRNLHQYLRALEQLIIETLAAYQINGIRHDAHTGVWVKTKPAKPKDDPVIKKIASVGVGVKNWVTFHGIGLNVCNMLAPFDAIAPCGLSGSQMTTMAEVLGQEYLACENFDQSWSEGNKILQAVKTNLIKHASALTR